MYNKCNQWLGGWRVSLPGTLGGFETRQKQIFHIFGTREKIRNFFFRKNRDFSKNIGILSGNIGFYRKKSVFIGKIGDFSPIFLLPIFHPKIFSSIAENRFFCP